MYAEHLHNHVSGSVWKCHKILLHTKTIYCMPSAFTALVLLKAPSTFIVNYVWELTIYNVISTIKCH